ncbi:hypothetical protein EUTSA_v10017577mg, partial [Eutrema salsugineum]
MYKDEPWLLFFFCSKEPWLLDHVNNDLFYENQWYYFVPRPKIGGKKPKRTVPGRGEIEGGTWRSVTSKKEIVNKKNQEGGLHSGAHDNLVLCKIRYNTDKKLKPEVGDQAPRLRNNVQVREDEEVDLTGFANVLEDMLVEGEEHGDVTQQQQQQDPPIFPPLHQGHDSGSETPMMTQSNDNNNMTMWTQSNDNNNMNQWDDFDFDGLENLMLDVDELIAVE